MNIFTYTSKTPVSEDGTEDYSCILNVFVNITQIHTIHLFGLVCLYMGTGTQMAYMSPDLGIAAVWLEQGSFKIDFAQRTILKMVTPATISLWA